MLLQGDGVWLPRAPFAGTEWVTALHRELFSEYTGWSFNFLELAATAGAMRGFTEVLGFFHWQANNTGWHHSSAAAAGIANTSPIAAATGSLTGAVALRTFHWTVNSIASSGSMS